MLTALQGFILLELPESFQAEILDLLTSKDKVPNIRLRVAQVLGKASARTRSDNLNFKIRPILVELTHDKDKDVRYFAEQSLKLC